MLAQGWGQVLLSATHPVLRGGALGCRPSPLYLPAAQGAIEEQPQDHGDCDGEGGISGGPALALPSRIAEEEARPLLTQVKAGDGFSVLAGGHHLPAPLLRGQAYTTLWRTSKGRGEL